MTPIDAIPGIYSAQTQTEKPRLGVPDVHIAHGVHSARLTVSAAGHELVVTVHADGTERQLASIARVLRFALRRLEADGG